MIRNSERAWRKMLSRGIWLKYAASRGLQESIELAGLNCHNAAALMSVRVQLPAPLMGLKVAGFRGARAA